MDERAKTHGFYTQFALVPVDHQTSRQLLETDLQGQLSFNDKSLMTSVFKVDTVPKTWIKAANKALDTIQDVFQELSNASNEPGMYKPLETILRTIIESAPNNASKYPRVIWKSSDSVLRDESKAAGLRRKPDFAFFDSENHGHLWRNCAAHVEVKAEAQEGPAFHDDPSKTPKNLLTQVADVGRAHLASRPFLLFSPCLMICGGDFYMSIWDRAGAVISQRCDLASQRELFVCLVFQIARRLTPVELGQDPTVTRCPAPSDQYTIKIRGLGDWTTTERIFQSVSLVGRGTSVWAIKNDKGEERVMKTAWRRISREGEAVTYDNIHAKLQAMGEQWPKGVARKTHGGDVAERPGGPLSTTTRTSQAITISFIRHNVGQALEENPVLHRILLAERGLPLWYYDKPSTLLSAMIDALKGHRKVCELGYLHQDISAGNVLLAANPETQGHYGFITDFDYAQKHPLPASAKKGPAISGTAQFMAYELLKALSSGEKLFHEAHHDIESFVWVFIYTIFVHDNLKNFAEHKMTNPQNWKKLDDNIQFIFGSTGLRKLAAARADLMMDNSAPLQQGSVLGDCVEMLLSELQSRYTIISANKIKRRQAANRKVEVNPRDLKLVPVLDHDFVITIFEDYKVLALADGQ